MKAPNEIVLTPCDFTDIGIFDIEEETKYIRELTWEDMLAIDEIIHDVVFDYRDKEISSEDFYKEALRRFNEHKKE